MQFIAICGNGCSEGNLEWKIMMKNSSHDVEMEDMCKFGKVGMSNHVHLSHSNILQHAHQMGQVHFVWSIWVLLLPGRFFTFARVGMRFITMCGYGCSEGNLEMKDNDEEFFAWNDVEMEDMCLHRRLLWYHVGGYWTWDILSPKGLHFNMGMMSIGLMKVVLPRGCRCLWDEGCPTMMGPASDSADFGSAEAATTLHYSGQVQGHFTHDPRAVTLKLWEPKGKSVQRLSQHTSNIM